MAENTSANTIDNDDAEKIIHQLAEHKLDYSRELLSKHELPKSGSKEKIRERLTKALEDGKFEKETLFTLLEELDLWGKQRLRLRKIAPELLNDFRNVESIKSKVIDAELGDIFDGKVALEPTEELTPMKVCCNGNAENLTLVFIAAKTREVWLPQIEIPNFTKEEYPDVVFRPFKLVHQKSISFAEVHVPSGNILISTTALMQGRGYNDEFSEFIGLFEEFFPFADSEPVELFTATKNINDISLDDVRFYSQKKKTASGTNLTYTANSLKYDFRVDAEITQSLESLPNASNAFCNCVWQTNDELKENVHTHIYAPDGQIAIMGGAREESARYVLRRIRELN